MGDGPYKRLLNAIAYLLPASATIRCMQQLVAGHAPPILSIGEAQGVQVIGSIGNCRPVIAAIARAIEFSALRIGCPRMSVIEYIRIAGLNVRHACLNPVVAAIV